MKGEGTTFRVFVTLGEADHVNTFTRRAIWHRMRCGCSSSTMTRIALEHAQIVLSQVGTSCEVARSGDEGLEMAAAPCAQ